METRCGSCNKLFRVSNDKITGTGIKFPCTRCGEYVKITKQDLDHHTLSLTAVSVLDMFEPKPKAVKPEATEPVTGEAAPAATEAASFDFSELSTEQDVREETPPPFVEPDNFFAPMPAEEPALAVEPQQPATSQDIKNAQFAKSQPEPALKSKASAESEVMTPPPGEPKAEPRHELVPVAAKPVFAPEPKTVPSLDKQPRPESARPATQTSSPSARPVQPVIPKKDQARPAVHPNPEQAVKVTLPSSKSSHSGRMILVLLATLIIGALAAYGVFVYLRTSPQQGKEAAPEMTSVQGIQIVNPTGSLEQNGDLLVTGLIENTTDKEIAAWYVVVEVYDSQSALLGKLRVLNGKQIYSRRDFDILAKRGINVQELKAKYLQEKGIVLLPKGSVNVEMRYPQPPAGIASFNALVLPFDPVQLYKEIAEEMK